VSEDVPAYSAVTDAGKLPRIGKLEAARRQIEFAIRAHFENRDPFAIHTVTEAAFGILRALAEKHGGVRAHQAIKDCIKPGSERTFWWYINRASNFLKHADRDPDATLEDVNEEINDSAIFIAVAYYGDLSAEPVSPIMNLFFNWHLCLHPNLMTEEFRSRAIARLPQGELDQLRKMPRKVLLEAGLRLIESRPKS
jgi:hypothetical protein